ncbi:MAG TPA: RtcB family protein [Polyangiaceae bacterium]
MSRLVFDADRGQRVPVRVWGRAISEDTIRQFVRLASQPYVVDHVAAMADAHLSEGIAVGTVFATEHAVVPRALGGDLGCGMSAIRLSGVSGEVERRTLQSFVELLGRAVPAGEAIHRGRGVDVPGELLAGPLSTHALEHTREALAPRHLGTLGGGNHFLELDRDPEGDLWLLVHSGSRGLGAAVAAHHARAAGASTSDPFAALDVREEPGRAYLADVEWALAFARENRRRLASRALDVLSSVLGAPVTPGESLDVHHNFVAQEPWGGRALLVHRKGAIAAPLGARALIPGSMGTASYVVEGLGEPASFGSCSHGAGRVLRRSEARERISTAALDRSMRHVVYPAHLARHLVEEAPAAYRDVREVLEDQEDLVVRRLRLEPLAVLKG